MNKKYLVFINSAQDDLKTARGELVRIVFELGGIPVILDDFDITARDDRRLIHKLMGECDYFLTITGDKGGKMAGDTLVLELSYNYAVKTGIPVLALISGEKPRRKAAEKEKDSLHAQALAGFKVKLQSHPHEKWANLPELKLKAFALLSREMNLSPRRGWVHADSVFTAAVANELSRLSLENESLRGKIAGQKQTLSLSFDSHSRDGADSEDTAANGSGANGSGTNDSGTKDTGVKDSGAKNSDTKARGEIRNALKTLAANRVSLSFFYVDSEKWENTQVFGYLRLFRLLAPELYTPKTAAEISHFLGNILNPDLSKSVRKDYPTPSNTIKKIMTDFALLKLVKHNETPDPNPHPRAGKSEHSETWEMTGQGSETFAAYRLRQMTKKAAGKE